MASKGRPFFGLDTNLSNPNNAEAAKTIASLADTGSKRGQSRSTDPQTGRKFPKGFTPPVDLYTDKGPILDSKSSELDPSQTNIYSGPSGKDPQTGRHIEYGGSITGNKGGGLFTKGGGGKNVTEFGGSTNPQLFIKTENLAPFARFVNTESIDEKTGYPVEYGQAIRNEPSQFDDSKTFERLGDRYLQYDYFNSWGNKNFTHLLDFFISKEGIPSYPRIIATDAPQSALQNVYLGSSFVRTFDDNEDPTILGVDIRFKSATSPLFNNALIGFIKAFGPTYQEISSREDIVYKLREQLLKFIPSDAVGDGGYKRTKSFYLQSVSGLDKLVEAAGSEPKYFIDFGKDLITLEFLEDVSQNMGYLSTLHKTLAWSKISGKQIIPSNLLRFDLELKITEMRNYKRNAKDPKNEKIISFNDRISTYYYTLYECQFLFDKMPHGDAVANGKADTLENFKLTFNYKFATLSFAKYDGRVNILPDGNARINYFIVNNLRKNLGKALPSENPPSTDIFKVDSYPRLSKFGERLDQQTGGEVNSNDLATNTIPNGQTEFDPTLEDFKESENLKSSAITNSPDAVSDQSRPQIGTNKQFDQIEAGLKNGQITQANNQVATQAALLNRTLGNINDRKGVGSIIPKNNFTNENNKSEIENRGKERGFFENAATDRLKRDLKNAVVNQINRTIVERARLLNNAIDEIRNKIPFAGRMSEPTNVYTGTNALRNDIINALRNFVGGSIASFFKKPI